MIAIQINGIPFFTHSSISILDACKNFGINLPRFCYHELLSISGNCRMCLVEIEGLEKPVAACVSLVEPNMSIWLDTPFVKKARENILESILMHHPLDCPICDQAGECDLQDITYKYGMGLSRFAFKKEAKSDLIFNREINTVMQRCIKCTRCVRYAEEITEDSYFGTLNRGRDTEISSFINSFYESELSGNVVDLCPVGALNSFNRAYKVRPWHLRVMDSCDDTNSIGSDIYLFYDDESIHKVLPKNQTHFLGGLITNNARYKFDRCVRPYFFKAYSNKTVFISDSHYSKSYVDIFAFLDTKLKTSSQFFNVFINEKIDFKSLLVLKNSEDLYRSTRTSKVCLTNLDQINYKSNLYIGSQNRSFEYMVQKKTTFLIIGTDLQYEHVLLHSRLKAKAMPLILKACPPYLLTNASSLILDTKHAKVVNFCKNRADSKEFINMDTVDEYINLSLIDVKSIFEGKCIRFSKYLKSSINCSLLIGARAFAKISDIDSFLFICKKNFNDLTILKLGLNSNSDGVDWSNIKQFRVPKKNSSYKDYFMSSTMLNISNLESVLHNYIFENFADTKISLSTNIDVFYPYDYYIPYKGSKETTYTFLNYEHQAKNSVCPEDKFLRTSRFSLPIILKGLFNIQNPSKIDILLKYQLCEENMFIFFPVDYYKYGSFVTSSTKFYLKTM